MKPIKDLPIHERPREKLLEKGAGFLSDRELLAVILGKGTQKDDVLSLSQKIVTIIDAKGLNFTAKDLMDLDGIGEARAAAVSAAFEFVRRRIKPEGLKIKFPADILPLIQHYGDRKQEHFLSVSLNGANEVMSVRVVSMGLVNKAPVHPREVFADIIAERASAVIVAHNHPSGDISPSAEDMKITKQLKEAAAILGLSLLDHIIFSTRGYYSFAEHHEL
ncbi:MAG: DNA repair protein RadC [Desulfobacula sp.]|nr:DNA repair protein RadC [Desulfobacula sp.]MDA8136208.1 DNA repair protein RadC [Desulfobacteraceae bacterium]